MEKLIRTALIKWKCLLALRIDLSRIPGLGFYIQTKENKSQVEEILPSFHRMVDGWEFSQEDDMVMLHVVYQDFFCGRSRDLLLRELFGDTQMGVTCKNWIPIEESLEKEKNLRLKLGPTLYHKHRLQRAQEQAEECKVFSKRQRRYRNGVISYRIYDSEWLSDSEAHKQVLSIYWFRLPRYFDSLVRFLRSLQASNSEKYFCSVCETGTPAEWCHTCHRSFCHDCAFMMALYTPSQRVPSQYFCFSPECAPESLWKKSTFALSQRWIKLYSALRIPLPKTVWMLIVEYFMPSYPSPIFPVYTLK